MGRAREHIEARRWSKGLLSCGVNGPRTGEDNNGLAVVLDEPSLLGKALWIVETQPSRECCTKGNHSFEDKHQRRLPTTKEEIFGEKATTTILNTLHQTNWPYLLEMALEQCYLSLQLLTKLPGGCDGTSIQVITYMINKWKAGMEDRRTI